MEFELSEGSEYKLSAVITAHTNDIKALGITDGNAIISASRDEWVRMFVNREGEFEKFLEINNKLVVNSVDVFHCPDGSILIFCGRKDGSIAAYNAESPNAQFMLYEHTMNVCILKVNQTSGQLISGSWDARAVVFNLNDLIYGKPPKQFTLEGHKNSIWGVEFVSERENHFLTASADKTIKLWSGQNTIRTFVGHKDVVRCLQWLGSDTFVSSGNDSTVRFWNLASDKCQQTLDSTPGEFIYSMSLVKASDQQQFIVTSGEGGYVEFYEASEKEGLSFTQIIRTPTTSLWSIKSLLNGDVAAAASNGCIYIFTLDPQRVANSVALETFNADVASKIAIEAEMKAAQETDTVTIKVSLDDSAPNLELKYVKGSNPTDAAEAFIRQHNLPYSYLNEITEFIKTNVPEAREYGAYQPAATRGSNTSFGGDPFTSGRYVPGASAGPTNGTSAPGDPYTSGGRYVPGQHNSNVPVPNSLTPVDKRRPRSQNVPVRSYYVFSEPASEKAKEALKNANQGIEANLMLEDPLVEALLEILSGDFTANEIHILALEKALQWPLQAMIPVLDAFRLGLLNQTINEYFCSTQGDCNRGAQVLERLTMLFISEPSAAIRILLCRSLANAAQHEAGRQMLTLNLSKISELISSQVFWPQARPPLQLAATSCLSNFSLILLRQTEKGVCAELGPREDVLRAIIKFAEKVLSFGDCSEPSLFRLLQAIVTLMWGDSTVLELGKSRGIDQIVSRIKDAVQSDESKSIARDIYAMIHAD